MPVTTEQFATRQSRIANNFGLLRLVFSLMVLLSHSFSLSTGIKGDPLLRATLGLLTFGGVAVDGFFLISGCLITQSWQRSRSPGEFVVRRVLRIYPAYLISLVFSIGVATVCAKPDPVRYLKSLYYQQDRGLQAVLFIEEGWLTQPTALTTNPVPHEVNASLWTLQPELKCYALTLLLGVFGLAGHRRAMLGISVLLYSMYTLNWLHLAGTDYTFLRFVTFFALGACQASGVFRSARWPLLAGLIFLAGLAVMLQSKPGLAIVFPLLFTQILFTLAHVRYHPGAEALARYDLSYGLYLFGFPVQQGAVALLRLDTPASLFGVSLTITTLLALASWLIVERPMIARSHRLAAGPLRAGVEMG